MGPSRGRYSRYSRYLKLFLLLEKMSVALPMRAARMAAAIIAMRRINQPIERLRLLILFLHQLGCAVDMDAVYWSDLDDYVVRVVSACREK